MALTQMRLFSNLRFSRIIGRLAARLDIERPLNFLNRLVLVEADDDELFGRFSGKVLAADLIADDQEALVQEQMTLDILTHGLPNIKHGTSINQKLLNKLRALQRGENVRGENALRNWDTSLASNLVLGVRMRMNAMAAAMMLDSFTYDRWGIKVSAASWGMPSNLKVTVGTTWATAATATPISDILALDQVAMDNYGIRFDTLIMSYADFRNMVATTEFANKASITVGAGFSLTSANLLTKDTDRMQALAVNILNKNIILDDTTYQTRSNDGTLTSNRVLPLNKVVACRAQDAASGESYDFGNAPVTEAETIPELTPGTVGPLGYFTPSSPDANPPGMNAWAVARAFPRKYVVESTAVLTV